MKNTSTLTVIFFLLFSNVPAPAAETIDPLRQSTIVEVINSVEVLTGDDLSASVAETGQTFRAPDFLQTGRRSRARLEAEDGTVTRVGSNTLFSFGEEERTIHLQKGSLLFHSPEGRGGGTIVTASATASVVGTTLLVMVAENGGIEILVLEGDAQTLFPDGTILLLSAGQMIVVQPDQPGTAGEVEVLRFDLAALTANSVLIQGFSEPLVSLSDILQAVAQAMGETGEMADVEVETLESDMSTMILLGSVVSASIDTNEVVFTNLGDGNRSIFVGPDGVVVVSAQQNFDPQFQRFSNTELRALSEVERRMMATRLQTALQQMLADLRTDDSELTEEDVVAVIKFILSVDLPWDEGFFADFPEVQAILGSGNFEDPFGQPDDGTPPRFEEPTPPPPPVVTPPITPGPYFAP